MRGDHVFALGVCGHIFFGLAGGQAPRWSVSGRSMSVHQVGARMASSRYAAYGKCAQPWVRNGRERPQQCTTSGCVVSSEISVRWAQLVEH